MHIPDGFIDAGTSAAAGVVAAGGVAVCLKKAGDTMQEKQVAMAGLVSAFIFAVQMLNFPVASGTSGHLLGGLLAAVLVGPWVGALCVSVVLFVQALVFADGGLSALGLNIINMALVTALGGYLIFRAIRAVGPRTKGGVVVASGLAGFCSVVLASLAFTLEYATGGTGGASVTTVFGRDGRCARAHRYRRGDHHRAHRRCRARGPPDLVYGARRPRTGARGPSRSRDDVGDVRSWAMTTRRRNILFFAAGAIVVALALAAFASPFASTQPDGLNKVAIDKGFDHKATDSAVAGGPLAGYAVRDVGNEKVSKGLSGVAGVAITLAVAGVVFGGLWLVVRRRSAPSSPARSAPAASG